ncbi:helix-turn-helix domain-containing protein [Paractinoplanes lichenicola]|uniref:Helix-turn-helix domain-containing protein n=1 Tax=Paractinoplanes lichenicola TaxID=2802976 RepID=A0ABS1VMA2_9ACTN|nr:helix-turn-helix domain-containing protein [Actinoplanes lichenicola]MBL7255621.1 helix-turn-helix domain-containing protein [Actinoplanes lichenicola]
MKDLAVRLAALDPDAGAALHVIAYFDRLAEARAGLHTIVRGAAVLSGCPARLVDDERRVQIRVEPDGAPAPADVRDGVRDEGWMSAPAGGATLWLERSGPPGPVDAMVLERASAAARSVLERTRGHAPQADPALVELVIDARAAEPLRLQAAARLGLNPHDPVRVVALESGAVRLLHGAGGLSGDRAGVGPAGPVTRLPASYEAAVLALRFTAAGTDQDPGPRVVHADELGGLALLAAAVGPGTEPVPDQRALDRAAATAPWVLATLDAVARSPSLRAAATALRVHHSTLQDRLAHTLPVLGWDVRDPQGRLRLQLALALRRLSLSRP